VNRRLVTLLAVSALSWSFLVSGCGGDQDTKVEVPDRSAGKGSSPTASAPAFTMPAPGDEIGDRVDARPADDESSEGAALFAAWTLSLLLHTPRDEATTALWSEAAGAGCDPCRRAASAWKEQVSQGQVFAYAGVPGFQRTAVQAQRQGANWFVQFEVAVPRSTLEQDGRVLQSGKAELLGYSFTVTWVEDAWRLTDFHVLG
jgi:hypothetical protein